MHRRILAVWQPAKYDWQWQPVTKLANILHSITMSFVDFLHVLVNSRILKTDKQQCYLQTAGTTLYRVGNQIVVWRTGNTLVSINQVGGRVNHLAM